ncbi:MAG TPA: ABC transporter ATP-binding protein [Acidobacteria bacterium]|nr:ABC transporter ATP-binding protein [Acidobacteriota bacterium]
MQPPSPHLSASELSVRLGRQAGPILRGVELELPAGTVTGLSGASGSGKTTLLHTLAGLLPWHRPAEVHGTIRLDGERIDDLDPGQRAHLLATALDRPEAQLFLPTPADELEAARRLSGPAGRSLEPVERLGLGPLLHRPVRTLSSGERQRVVLATVLSAGARPVLLDEPTAHLDAAGVRAVAGLLRDHAREGGSVFLSEHSGWRLAGAAGSWLGLEARRLREVAPPRPPRLPAPPHRPGATEVLTATGLALRRGARTLLEDGSLRLHEGEIVLLRGPNGAGKSTLARVLAGLDRPIRGTVVRAGPVALLMPSPDLQLFATTVAGEVVSTGAGPRDAARVLRRHGLEHLASRAPWTLSRGERQRLVHAVLDLLQPAVMILDEPAQGLDGDDLAVLVDLIHRRAERGRAHLLITHREELAVMAHRTLHLAGGRLQGGEAAP